MALRFASLTLRVALFLPFAQIVCYPAWLQIPVAERRVHVRTFERPARDVERP